MKHLFVCEFNTLFGERLCARFGKTHEFDIIGTLRPDEMAVDAALAQRPPPFATEVVPRYSDDPVTFKRRILESDIIICPLRDSIEEAAAAARMLSNTPFNTEKTFVLVSSVQTWANTIAAQKAEAAAEREAERQAAIDAGEEPPEDAVPGEEPEEMPSFTDDQYQKRVPHRRYQHWKELEQFVKKVNSDTLHTHVVFAGLQYGRGEDLLHHLFRAAWHHQPLPQYTAGGNTVPMIHVDDLVTAVFKLSTALEPVSHRYMLGVDRGNCTWGSVIKAINGALGCDETFPCPEARHGSVAGIDNFTVDMKFEASVINDFIDEEEWVSAEGLVAGIEKVVQEYKVARHVTPVRLLMLGPPLCGKSTVAQAVATEYGLMHLTIPSIIEDYTQHSNELQQRLATIRREKAEAKRRAAKEAKKKELLEAKAAEAEAAAEKDGTKKPDGDGEDDEEEKEKSTKADSLNETAAPVAARDEEEEDDFDLDEVAAPAVGEQVEEGEEGGSPAAQPEKAQEVQDEEENEEPDEPLVKLKEEVALAKRVLQLKLKQRPVKPDPQLNTQLPPRNLHGLPPAKDQKAPTPSPPTPTPPVSEPPRFADAALASMVRWRILQKDCRNPGYVMDGFPKTVKQAQLAFIVGEVPLPEPQEEPAGEGGEDGAAPPAEPPPEEEEDTTTLMSAVDDRVLPELAVILRADDAVLQSRSRADVPDSHHSSLASFYRRMAAYRANHTATSKPQKSVIAWCRAILTNVEGHPRAMSMLMLDTTSIASSEEEYSSVKHSIREAIGVPHFYRPTAPEVREAEATARLVEERRQLEALKAAEEAEKKRIEAEEAALKKKRIHERRYCSIQEEQKLAAAMQRMPLQSYLMETVVRAITEGIQATSELRPPDPVDSLADFLFKYKPNNTLQWRVDSRDLCPPSFQFN